MWIYFLLLILTTFMVLAQLGAKQNRSNVRLGLAWPAFFTLISLIIGFRFEVGGDWGSYIFHVDKMRGEPLDAVFWYGDPAYELLNWVGANFGGGIYFVNLVCAAFFSWGLASFCRSQPRPWLALLVAIPYLMTVVAMGYSRQGVAIGLAMLAMTKLQNGNVIRFVFWIALASLFHKSAVILIAFAVFAASRYRLFTFIGVGISAVVLFFLLLQEQLEYFTSTYIEAEYSSSGAAIRILMNAIPAVIFLLLKERFVLDSRTRSFWIWMAWGAVLFVPLLAVSPSSTAVDRLALYWIPLQLVVFSRLPDVFGILGRKNPTWVSFVLAYSAAVMLGWFIFADTAHAWLPYRFYPWEAMWS